MPTQKGLEPRDGVDEQWRASSSVFPDRCKDSPLQGELLEATDGELELMIVQSEQSSCSWRICVAAGVAGC